MLMYSKTKTKDSYIKHFCMACLQNFTNEKVLSNHKKQCLLINGCQAVNYESETMNQIKIMKNKYLYHLKYMLTHYSF